MGSKLLISFVFLLLPGCAQEPLGLEENRPTINDAPIDRDVVIYGTMDVLYTTRGDNPQYVCAGDYDVTGWVEQELDSTDVGCTGCSENYTIGPEFVDSDCNTLRARGAPTVALLDFSFFPHDGTSLASSTFDFLTGEFVPAGAGGRAERFGLSNWNSLAFYEDNALDGYLGVYPSDESPTVPDGVECARELFLRQTPAVPLNNDTAARWTMNLCFTD